MNNKERTHVTRSLHEWDDFILAERAKRAKLWDKQWLFRQWVHRSITAERLRTWSHNARHQSNMYADLVSCWTGLSPAEQIRQMAVLKLRHDITPQDYYTYRLYRPARFKKAGRYIRHERQVRSIWYLIDAVYDKERPTREKRIWYEWALHHDVPTPTVLASFEDGMISPSQWDGHARTLPSVDLFCKWTNLWRGIDAECWLYQQGRYVNTANRSDSRESSELINHLKEKSHERPLLLQERVRNHPLMRGYTSGGLATCRLITGRFPCGFPQPITAFLKMPRGSAVTDNMGPGAVSASVDLSSGRLGPAESDVPEPAGDLCHVHPDTGFQITGSTFPCWEDVLELAISTHQKLENMPFVGWDVTVAEEGPMIVEPNNGWGAVSAEKTGGTPLSDTLYQKMYDAWMGHALNQTQQ